MARNTDADREPASESARCLNIVKTKAIMRERPTVQLNEERRSETRRNQRMGHQGQVRLGICGPPSRGKCGEILSNSIRRLTHGHISTVEPRAPIPAISQTNSHPVLLRRREKCARHRGRRVNMCPRSNKQTKKPPSRRICAKFRSGDEPRRLKTQHFRNVGSQKKLSVHPRRPRHRATSYQRRGS